MAESTIATHGELWQRDVLGERQVSRFATDTLEPALVETMVPRTAHFAKEHNRDRDEDGGKGRSTIFRMLQASPTFTRGNQAQQVDGGAEQEGTQIALRAFFLPAVGHAHERIISRSKRSRPAAAWQRHMPHS